jgi:trans-aconitate 2-methyltransferase
MLAKARKRLPDLTFEQVDAATWEPREPADVIFANAVFQWLPDHLTVLKRLMEKLAPGGVLAVQMPDNLTEPSHRLMREAAAPFADKLAGAARDPLPPVAAYYDALIPYSARLDIWHTFYNHPLASASAIVEWLKGTGLRPFLDPLDANEQVAFLDDYLRRIGQAYPPMTDGKVLLRFPRLFVVAVKG